MYRFLGEDRAIVFDPDSQLRESCIIMTGSVVVCCCFNRISSKRKALHVKEEENGPLQLKGNIIRTRSPPLDTQ
jgi:hypothetical protein